MTHSRLSGSNGMLIVMPPFLILGALCGVYTVRVCSRVRARTNKGTNCALMTNSIFFFLHFHSRNYIYYPNLLLFDQQSQNVRCLWILSINFMSFVCRRSFWAFLCKRICCCCFSCPMRRLRPCVRCASRISVAVDICLRPVLSIYLLTHKLSRPLHNASLVTLGLLKWWAGEPHNSSRLPSPYRALLAVANAIFRYQIFNYSLAVDYKTLAL